MSTRPKFNWQGVGQSVRENSRPSRSLQAQERLPPLTDADFDHARAFPIERELERRRIKLDSVDRKANLAGPCPVCGGDPKKSDRFGVSTRKQVWNCRGCGGHGDIIALVMHLDGVTFIEAIRYLVRKETLEPAPPLSAEALKISRPPPAEPDPDNSKRALQIWHKAVDPRGSPVETYLKGRGLDLPDEAAFEAIRYQPRLFFRGETFPAMICLVRGIDGDAPQAVHITSLGDPPEGRKRGRYSYGPIAGGAIKLTPDADVTLCLGVGEGIESTLSLRCWDCFGASPVWSLISKNGVEALPVLTGIETLWIAVDDDPNGIAAAETVSARWFKAGREVFKLKAKIPGADLNDAIRQRMAES
jgi:Toprim domain/CHC2 zinc finger